MVIHFRNGKIFIEKGSIAEKLVILYYRFAALTPWKKAITLLAFKEYLEGEWFRERNMTLGTYEAVSQFYIHDYKFLTRAAWKKHKWKIVLTPYTCIEEAKRTMVTVNAMGVDLKGAINKNTIKEKT